MSSPEYPVGSHETPASPEHVRGELLRDFYQSFRYAQGDGNMQCIFFQFISNRYRTQMDEAQIKLLEEVVNSTELHDRVSKLTTPTPHKTRNKDDVNNMFESMFRSFQRYLLDGNVPPLSSEQLDYLVDSMVYADYGYQKLLTPRPGAELAGRDPHYSYFRQHILFQQPSNSEAYNALFKALYEHTFSGLSEDAEYWIPHLANNWQNMHEGEVFYPDHDFSRNIRYGSPPSGTAPLYTPA